MSKMARELGVRVYSQPNARQSVLVDVHVLITGVSSAASPYSLHVHADDRGKVESERVFPQLVRLIRDKVAKQCASGTHLTSATSPQPNEAYSKRRMDIDPASHLEQAEAHLAHAVVEDLVRKVHTLLVQEGRIALAEGPVADCALFPRQPDG